MKISDRLFGLLIVLLGGSVLLYGTSLPNMPGQNYGAGLFPTIVGGLLIISGALLSITGWLARDRELLLARAEWAKQPASIVNLVLAVASLLAFALGIRDIGFPILAFVCVSVLLLRFGQPVWCAALIGLATAGFFEVVFVRLMRLPLPSGLLSGIL